MYLWLILSTLRRRTCVRCPGKRVKGTKTGPRNVAWLSQTWRLSMSRSPWCRIRLVRCVLTAVWYRLSYLLWLTVWSGLLGKGGCCPNLKYTRRERERRNRERIMVYVSSWGHRNPTWSAKWSVIQVKKNNNHFKKLSVYEYILAKNQKWGLCNEVWWFWLLFAN